MIDFLKTWSNQIIVAVIIATILEMIIPDGNNKKYIKMVIGIYVLFTIIQPIITKVTGNRLDISNFNYKKYFDEDIIETSTQEFENNNSKLIKQAYIDNMKNDIETKVKQKGYEVTDLNINIIENENQDIYGTIKNISLKITKLEEDRKEINEKITNTIKINNVDINISNNVNNNSMNNETDENSSISEKEQIEIIEFLSNEYSIDKKSIVINQ